MNSSSNYWKRLAAQSISSFVNSPVIRNILDKHTYSKSDLKGISVGKYTYTDQKNLHLSQPESAGPLPKEIDELCGDHQIPKWSVYEICDCELIGPNALTVTSDNSFILANSLEVRQLLGRDLVRVLGLGMMPRYSGEATDQIDLAVSLVGPWSTGFFHWFAQYLPQLEGIRYFESQTGERPTIIIPRDPPGWLINSLDLLGFDSDRIIEWNERRASVKRLIIPEIRHAPVESGHIHDPFGMNWVGNKLKQGVTSTNQNWPSRIYISRNDADERRVTNEEQVVQSLSDYDFSKVILSNYSLSEQIAMFREANMVVSPHGAGLVNTIYSNDISIVEAFGSYCNGCYFTLSGLDKITYNCVIGKSVGSDIQLPAEALPKSWFTNNH